MLSLAAKVLKRSFEHLRACGAGRTECVVYWIGSRDQPGHVDEVVHPRHTASAAGYDVDPAWIGELWLDLAARGRTVRSQVHTHPGSAFHSGRDDHLPLIHTPGYLSLVIPNFAQGAVGLRGAHLAERSPQGHWIARDPQQLIEVQA